MLAEEQVESLPTVINFAIARFARTPPSQVVGGSRFQQPIQHRDEPRLIPPDILGVVDESDGPHPIATASRSTGDSRGEEDRRVEDAIIFQGAMFSRLRRVNPPINGCDPLHDVERRLWEQALSRSSQEIESNFNSNFGSCSDPVQRGSPRPASLSHRQRLPGSVAADVSCCICLEATGGETTRCPNFCAMVAHNQCLALWCAQSQHSTCPLCRTAIILWRPSEHPPESCFVPHLFVSLFLTRNLSSPVTNLVLNLCNISSPLLCVAYASYALLVHTSRRAVYLSNVVWL